MSKKALIVIDLQNDITKHYRDIIDNINSAIDWAVELGMTVIYIKHNNLSPGTRTFKPDTKGAELVPELKIVSDNIFVKTKANALTSEAFSAFMNKVTGVLLFLLPLTIPAAPLKYAAVIVCTAATFAAIQEGHLIRTGRE